MQTIAQNPTLETAAFNTLRIPGTNGDLDDCRWQIDTQG